MIKLGVIGLGSIFPMQLKALDILAEKYQLAAVCDNSFEKREKFERTIRPALSGVSPRIYETAAQLYEDPNVDAVLIATPPATHYPLTLAALQSRKIVLLEKPAVLRYDDLVSLYAEADYRNVQLHIAFHAAFAKDLEWFLKHSHEVVSSPPATIECRFYDPYMLNHEILPEKRALGGCYIDSGVNALSVCARLTDLRGFSLRDKTETAEDNAFGVVYEACHTFVSGNQRITLMTGWNQGINHKSTVLRFRDTDMVLLLNHSDQQVILRHGNRESVIFHDAGQERLVAHYCGVFQDFADSCQAGRDNREMAKGIHKLLLSAQELKTGCTPDTAESQSRK